MATPHPPTAETVKHYPSLGAAALHAQDAPCFRTWLISRHLDKTGRGWLNLATLTSALTDPNSATCLLSRKRLRQILLKGEGRYWTHDVQGRLWLHGAARVAAALGVSRLTGQPVQLPLAALTQTLKACKAHLYAAWHSGRKNHQPISRQVQRTLTGIPERTQRAYGRLTPLQVHTNIAIGAEATPTAIEECAWRQGQATFVLHDRQGQQGRPGQHYLAWQLPNSYIGPHPLTPKGRQKKINRQLADLVNKRAQGNCEQKVEQLFCTNGKDASLLYRQRPDHDVYWPLRTQSQARLKFWGVLPQVGAGNLLPSL
ncbi:MAG: hypothetical protein IPL78_28210 [Chloroflexi bacterium]|nr:hypothetical protein [Chloroflexota bacterium]